MTSQEPERLTIEASGMRFGALAWGDPDAPLALLVHGYPDTAWTWRHLGPHLAGRGRRVVAPFTRGYAPTDLAPDDDYLLSALAGDLLALHDALGGDERAVLVGHDWGAAALWQVVATEPSRFARHVALSLPPPPALLKPFMSVRTLGVAARQSRMSWYFVANQLPGSERAQDRLIPRLWRDWSPAHDATEDLVHVFAALDSHARRRAAMRYYRNNLQRGLKDTFTVRPRAPVLHIHGAQDGCMHPDLGARYLATLPPGSRYEVIQDAGHFPQLEQPDRVGDLIDDWIGPPT